MTDMALNDPTVDVCDVEKYRLAFLMQFFVQHKRRFRFPRLRLQDLYQRVIKHPDVTAFCDLVARILRFLSHGDPEVCIDNVDQALDRFAMEKRTPYRINMQRHRNGKPVHQLGSDARAALLENLIESVYDEQPDFNFTAGFNPSSSTRSSNAQSIPTHMDDKLFHDSHEGAGEFSDSEDVNVLIKAGQDAQGCSYYYMDDLRLYRERPQNGICSQWDVAVGPTAQQWQSFIASLSKNEKEYDLYCFLNQDLFELVKQSLDNYELHAPNNDLDSANLRAKESNELKELLRRKEAVISKTSHALTGNGQVLLGSGSALTTNGPKSASPAFSGGHAASNVGNMSSGAPLTPTSARTPTSAPPITALHGASHPLGQPEPTTITKPEIPTNHETFSTNASATDTSTTIKSENLKNETSLRCESATLLSENHVASNYPNDASTAGAQRPSISQLPRTELIANAIPSAGQYWTQSQPKENPGSCPSVCIPSTEVTDALGLGTEQSTVLPQGFPVARQQSAIGSLTPFAVKSNENSPLQRNLSGWKEATEYNDQVEQSSQHLLQKHPDSVKADAPNYQSFQSDVPHDMLDGQFPMGYKTSVGPTTALVPPMMGIPDGGPALTQEQWENRKSKIAQLEKIHSSLSKSKSASTPGAVAVGAVFQARAQQNGSIPSSLALTPQQQCYPGGMPSMPCQPIQRQIAPDPYSSNRYSGPVGTPPVEVAQREWNRLCMDHQRDKLDPVRPRPQMNSDHSLPQEQPNSPMTNGMILMDDVCPRQPVDGPPVMMVPPNNSNYALSNSSFPPGSVSLQHHRCASSFNHHDQVPSMMLGGQKRTYGTPSGDPWYPHYTNTAVNQSPMADSLGYPNVNSSLSAYPGSRLCAMGSVTSNPACPQAVPSNSMAPASNRATNVGKVGGKKRKTVSSGRVNPAQSMTNQSVPISSPPTYLYCKGSAGAPLTATKPSYPSTYASDSLPYGYHNPRSAYMSAAQNSQNAVQLGPNMHPNYPAMEPCFSQYQDVPGAPVMGRSMSATLMPMDNRRVMTPKGNEMFNMNAMGSSIACNPMSSGRGPSNCGPVYPVNAPMTHSYMHPTDGIASDGAPGSRLAVSCTQHLTSASLASLARLSQLSGPEGPYVSSASLTPSNSGASTGAGSHASRLCNADNPSVAPMQYQTPRYHPNSVASGVKIHDPDIGAVHPKFASHMYPGPQPNFQPESSIQPPTQAQNHAHQPPSIQVNNTFFNAQLNVQQMNYQHLTAPGSTGQMQIHFVQQQQQQGESAGGTGNKAPRPPETVSRIPTSACNVAETNSQYYSASGAVTPSGAYSLDSSCVRSVPFGTNQAAPSEATLRSEPPPPTSMGYGNTSVQITPRTPHTIQYLPTAVQPSNESTHSTQNYQTAEAAIHAKSKTPRATTVNQYNFSAASDPVTPSDPTRTANRSNCTAPQQRLHQQQFASNQHLSYASQSTRAGQPPPGSNWAQQSECRAESNVSAMVGNAPPESEVSSSARVQMPPQNATNGPPFPIESAGAQVNQWSADSSGSVHRAAAVHQYHRQNPAPGRHEYAHMQRQQQYQHQSSHQQQMFMSSSMGDFSDCSQMQFMMSTSSSSAVQASSTTNLVTTVNNQPPAQVVKVESQDSVNSECKPMSKFDPTHGSNAKRPCTLSTTYDERKPATMMPASHIQNKSNQMNWGSVSDGQYSSNYCQSGYPNPIAHNVGIYESSLNNRDMLAAQQPLLYDVPSQTFSSSALP